MTKESRNPNDEATAVSGRFIKRPAALGIVWTLGFLPSGYETSGQKFAKQLLPALPTLPVLGVVRGLDSLFLSTGYRLFLVRASKLKETRDRINCERENHGVETERQNPVQQHQPPHFSRRNIHIGNLAGHADDKREIGEITIIWQFVLRKLKAAGVFLCTRGAIIIESVGVAQSEDGMHQ